MKRSCTAMLVWIIALAVLSACASPTPTSLPMPAQRATAAPSPTRGAATAQPPTGWPMFRYSLDRAGYNPYETDVRPPLELKWEFKAQSKI